jgi:hypothetical protein
MDVVVYTAVFNDYDILRGPVIRNDSVRYVCFSDRAVARTDGWEIARVDLPARNHPYAQRFHKIMSHRVLPDADVTLYLDGNFQLLVDPHEIIGDHLNGADLALFRHPSRQDVYAELEACAARSKDDEGLLQVVAERYAEEGMPRDRFLHAAGMILRRHTPEVLAFNEVWFNELLQTGVRDQPALAHSLWKTGIAVETIDDDIRDNSYVGFHQHKTRLLRKSPRFLFIAGNPRTGTTALCELLNHDHRIVLGMERYRKVRTKITPEHFMPDVFLAPTEDETTYLPARLIPPNRPGFTIWPEDETAVRAKWDSGDLVYVGDKAPFYLRQLPYLRETFAGARFVVAIRDPVAVADSYQRRAIDPKDHWPSVNDHMLAIEHWNQSVKSLLRYLDRFGLRDIFLVDDSFFSGDHAYLHSLYRFLDLDVPPNVVERFETMTAGWDERKTRPLILDEKMMSDVEVLTDSESYSTIKRLLPMMQDYHLLDSERKAWARSEALHTKDEVAYRNLHKLSRHLFLKLQDDIRGDSTTQNALEAEHLWRRFWAL